MAHSPIYGRMGLSWRLSKPIPYNLLSSITGTGTKTRKKYANCVGHHYVKNTFTPWTVNRKDARESCYYYYYYYYYCYW